MAEQDYGYKRLFAHREMVADLLTGFVREPWVAEVELDTLLAGRMPDAEIPEIESLQEARTMLAERVQD